MDIMTREISLAGYDPTCRNIPSNYWFYGVTVSSSQLQIKANLSGGSRYQYQQRGNHHIRV